MSKQSSIDKFVQQLKRKGLLITEDSEYIVAYLEAKAMHKEQIIDAIFLGMQKGLNVNKVPETDNDWVNNYYNETFGGEEWVSI